MLAAEGGRIPATVRDAVLARASRLGDRARRLLDAVAVFPVAPRVELLEAVARTEVRGLDECLAAGMLRAERTTIAFRHELARLAIEESIPAHRAVLLHRAALAALASSDGADPARLAHHRRRRETLPRPGERARRPSGRSAHAHREAATTTREPLSRAELPLDAPAELLARLSRAPITDRAARPRAPRRRSLPTAAGRRPQDRRQNSGRVALLRRWAARRSCGPRSEAVEVRERSTRVELAGAYANWLLAMLEDDSGGPAWAQGTELAEAPRTTPSSTTLATVGASEAYNGAPKQGSQARAKPELRAARDDRPGRRRRGGCRRVDPPLDCRPYLA